jgi:methylated-DNA-[protein]-cysteine S-methyltransferase
VLVAAIEQLHQYLRGERTGFDLPLDLAGGTPFQQACGARCWPLRVWPDHQLRRAGQQLGRPAAVRAVGAAVGRNPVSVVVPCHRVLGSVTAA